MQILTQTESGPKRARQRKAAAGTRKRALEKKKIEKNGQRKKGGSKDVITLSGGRRAKSRKKEFDIFELGSALTQILSIPEFTVDPIDVQVNEEDHDQVI